MTDQELTITQKVATFIKQKRLALGMSQREFAVYLFNDAQKQGWICRIENGRGISLQTVELILNALNCDIGIIEY